MSPIKPTHNGVTHCACTPKLHRSVRFGQPTDSCFSVVQSTLPDRFPILAAAAALFVGYRIRIKQPGQHW